MRGILIPKRMNGFSMHTKSLSEIADSLDKKEITATQLASVFLDRIKKHNPTLNAFITVDEARLMKEAEESEMRRNSNQALSRFDGIPVAIKDNICTEGLLTTCGSKILHNFIPPYSATAYERLRGMGFVTLGKTNMDEFAMGSSTETSFFGPAKNPFDVSKVPGGSSGGSAVAVAARLAPVALGSDTGGSIRQPAAFCGIVGIKPTYGRVSRYGLVAYASSLDQIGAFGKNVDDAALLLSVISGHDSKDATSVSGQFDFLKAPDAEKVKGMAIGVPEEYFVGVDPEVSDVVKTVIEKLESFGAKAEKISLRYTDYAVPVYYLIATAEASSNLARFDGVQYGYRSNNAGTLRELYFKTRSEGFGTEVKRRIVLGTFALSSGYYDAYYLKALKVRRLIIEDFKNALTKVDVIIAPTTTIPAFGIGEKLGDPLAMYMSDILTISANLAGIPSISVPAGLSSKGLPIGVQIMGRHFDERNVLDCAKAVEILAGTCDPSL